MALQFPVVSRASVAYIKIIGGARRNCFEIVIKIQLIYNLKKTLNSKQLQFSIFKQLFFCNSPTQYSITKVFLFVI